MPAPLDWDDLRFFLRAVDARTLAGAARTMKVEHTTVGRRLTALERSLGAPLVLRRPDGLALTPLGESVVPFAREVERAVEALHAHVATRGSRVRLAMPTGLTSLLSSRIAELHRTHPGVAIELLTGARPVSLEHGEADLAVRSGPVSGADLVTRRIGESGWSLYASKAYVERRGAPADLDDLSGHDLIGYDPSLGAVPAAQWIEARAARATVVVRSREMTDMLEAAKSGLGLAVLPCLLADAEPSLRRLTPEVLATRPVSLVYRREAKLSAAMRGVMKLVVDAFRQNAERLRGGKSARPAT